MHPEGNGILLLHCWYAIVEKDLIESIFAFGLFSKSLF